jgi:hypothetical protein
LLHFRLKSLPSHPCQLASTRGLGLYQRSLNLKLLLWWRSGCPGLLVLNTSVAFFQRHSSKLFHDGDRKHTHNILSHDDPFYHHIDYSPTSKEDIDRGANAARRLLTPHSLILQLLLSRLQAARYGKPGLMRIILRIILESTRVHRSMR